MHKSMYLQRSSSLCSPRRGGESLSPPTQPLPRAQAPAGIVTNGQLWIEGGGGATIHKILQRLNEARSHGMDKLKLYIFHTFINKLMCPTN